MAIVRRVFVIVRNLNFSKAIYSLQFLIVSNVSEIMEEIENVHAIENNNSLPCSSILLSYSMHSIECHSTHRIGNLILLWNLNPNKISNYLLNSWISFLYSHHPGLYRSFLCPSLFVSLLFLLRPLPPALEFAVAFHHFHAPSIFLAHCFFDKYKS